MKNKLLVFVIALFLSFLANTGQAQMGKVDGSKFGHNDDSINCITNLSLYRQYFRENNFSTALTYWKLVFDECPLSTKNIYTDGAKIYKTLLDSLTHPEKKKDYCDTLMLIYERRIESFGEKGKVREYQGIDLLKYSRNDGIIFIQQGYNLLKEAIELKGIEVSKAVLPTYLSASIILYKSNKLTAYQTIDDYLRVSDIIASKVQNNQEDKNLPAIKLSMDNNFISEGPSDCNILIESFSSHLKNKKNNIELLKVCCNLLEAHRCIENDFYFNTLVHLFQLDPSAVSAKKIAKYAFEHSKYSDAADYYQQAVDLELDDSLKSDYFMGIAQAQFKLGDKVKSREAAQKSAGLNPMDGEPYLLIGQLYADSKTECLSGKNYLEGAEFWLAVDMFNKAKKIDPGLKERADKLIMTYNKYFPTKENMKLKLIKPGDAYTLECWINEKTTAR